MQDHGATLTFSRIVTDAPVPTELGTATVYNDGSFRGTGSYISNVGCSVGVVFEGYFSGDGGAMNLTATVFERGVQRPAVAAARRASSLTHDLNPA